MVTHANHGIKKLKVYNVSTTLNNIEEPILVKEALKNLEWYKAMQAEFETLIEQYINICSSFKRHKSNWQ